MVRKQLLFLSRAEAGALDLRELVAEKLLLFRREPFVPEFIKGLAARGQGRPGGADALQLLLVAAVEIQKPELARG